LVTEPLMPDRKSHAAPPPGSELGIAAFIPDFRSKQRMVDEKPNRFHIRLAKLLPINSRMAEF